MGIPLGVPLNNPLNMERGPNWQGLAEVQSNARFCEFQSVNWCFRAAAIQAQAYRDSHDIRTVRQYVMRYAPPADNNNVDAYLATLKSRGGLDADAMVDVASYPIISKLLYAQCYVEVGGFEEFGYTQDMLNDGLRRAGIVGVPEPAPTGKPMGTKLALPGIGLAGAAELGKPILDFAKENMSLAITPSLTSFLHVVAFAGLGLVVLELILHRMKK